MARGELDAGRSVLIRLSAALAGRNPDLLDAALAEAARVGEKGQVEEVILQSYLFLGYPIALNAFALWREKSARTPPRGIPDDWQGWSQRGEQVCKVVYGGQYEGLRRNVRELHPDMERWMVVEGYGKVLGRAGMDLATRELCIVALLVVLRAPRQLYSHLRGALNAGAGPSEVEFALSVAGTVDQDAEAEALGVWERVKGRVSVAGPIGSSRVRSED